MIYISEEEYLMHHGVSKRDGAPIGSGRHPLGSGQRPFQNYREFRNRRAQLIEKFKKEGMNSREIEKAVSDYFHIPMRRLRDINQLAKAQVDREDYYTIKKMMDAGRPMSEIIERTGRSATGIKDLMARDAKRKANKINDAVNLLKNSLDIEGGYIDLSSGSEYTIGISTNQKGAVIEALKNDPSVDVVTFPVKQMFGKGVTNTTMLVPAGTTKAEIMENLDKLRPPVDIKIDSDDKPQQLRPVQNVDPKRIAVVYGDEGGTERDGMIGLRRGVEDLDLGKAKYAQVRIAVDGTDYIKGMAVYDDNIPDGKDIVIYSNRKKGVPLKETEADGGKSVLKAMKEPGNELNPFGAAIRPGLQRGALNIINAEGHWEDWSKSLASQLLSKQPPSLAQKQLKLSKDIAAAELEEYKSLTNPTIKRYLLDKFAEKCDSDAVNLKAAAFPRQASKVILPIPSLKENEVYAPTYEPGEQVALIRYPHGGKFEIPIVKVNNNNPEAKRVMGNARDAIGINSKVANVLSGADFDGDTVLVIPMTSARLKGRRDIKASEKALLDLSNFDPKEAYPGDNLSPRDIMKKKSTGNYMGRATNLITDMTVKGASPEHIARAVKYSMVVIDAAKHKLDHKKAYKDLGIKELKELYQGTSRGGASTIISRAKSPDRPEAYKEIRGLKDMTPEERARYDAGEKIYRKTGEIQKWERVKDPAKMTPEELERHKAGKKVYRDISDQGKKVTMSSLKMREAKDPYTLTSGGSKENPGTVIEKYYADYASYMKALANESRKASRSTGKLQKSNTAAKVYAEEVKSLNDKYVRAVMNRPKERQAQALANSTANAEIESHPEYDDDQQTKCRSRALEYARAVTGAKKIPIDITDREWEAIQAGAISDSRLSEMLKDTNIDELRQRALPKNQKLMSDSRISRAETMLAQGFTWNDVAKALGVSESTVRRALKKSGASVIE